MELTSAGRRERMPLREARLSLDIGVGVRTLGTSLHITRDGYLALRIQLCHYCILEDHPFTPRQPGSNTLFC